MFIVYSPQNIPEHTHLRLTNVLRRCSLDPVLRFKIINARMSSRGSGPSWPPVLSSAAVRGHGVKGQDSLFQDAPLNVSCMQQRGRGSQRLFSNEGKYLFATPCFLLQGFFRSSAPRLRTGICSRTLPPPSPPPPSAWPRPTTPPPPSPPPSAPAPPWLPRWWTSVPQRCPRPPPNPR